jgi:hypothetical protein
MRCLEPPVHLGRRARGGLVGGGGPGLLAADGAAQAHLPHQAFHRATGHHDACPAELPPDLAGAVDPEVGRMDPSDLLHKHLILLVARRGLGRIGTLRDMGVVGRRGDRQHPADRLDPVDLTMLVNEGDHGFERRSSSAIAKYAEALIGIRGDGRMSCHQSRDEGAKQGFAPAPGVVHELEKAEIQRQLLLRDAAVWPQPGA